jgi:hypothetical protein
VYEACKPAPTSSIFLSNSGEDLTDVAILVLVLILILVLVVVEDNNQL